MRTSIPINTVVVRLILLCLSSPRLGARHLEEESKANQRGSLEVYDDPEVGHDEEAPLVDAAAGDDPGRSASWCRSVAVTFTVVLLLRHLAAVVTAGVANQYALGLLTVYMLRASGILVPFYVVMRLISAIQHGQRQYRLQLLQEQRRNASRMLRLQGGQEQQPQHHVILVR